MEKENEKTTAKHKDSACGSWSQFFFFWMYIFYVFWLFGHKACGTLASQPGIEPVHPALEGRVLTTGPPGKSPWS